MQFQAGLILESVRNHLKTYAKQHKKEAELNGLLRSLCTFDVETTLNFEISTGIPSILAVALNILTRGLPTLTSIHIEEEFAQALNRTTRFDDENRGKIGFPFINNDVQADVLYKALHTIDPRAKLRSQY